MLCTSIQRLISANGAPVSTYYTDKPPQSVDPSSQSMIDKAGRDGVLTAFERAQQLKPCPLGSEGSCCRVCAMGPCRLTKPDSMGVCGATRQTVSARNFARMVAAGTAAHADHARGVVSQFLAAAAGCDFHIKDDTKLLALAADFGIETQGRELRDVARLVGERLKDMFGQQDGDLPLTRRAPATRQERWHDLGVTPRGIDREIVELMHRAHMGVDQDFHNLLLGAARCSLADGWGGSMIATDIGDALFGTPTPTMGNVNLGVLNPSAVNIVVHGHDAALSELMVAAVNEPSALEAAKKVGATGINIVGMCCTAGDVLVRHGIPLAGNFLMQELAIVTGSVEAMVLDIQCEMQGLREVAKCYHTLLITTSNKARIEGVLHMDMGEVPTLEGARNITRRAIARFSHRGRVEVPPETSPALVGFSTEAIQKKLGGSLKPLADCIITGKIRGLAAVVGCNNARVPHDSVHLQLVLELLKKDILVLTTGCAAIAFGKAGFLSTDAIRFAGPGLSAVCRAVDIPPVLHMGACVGNSRLLMAATALLAEGGLGQDLSDLPLAGAAPEWMSEKALAIGQYFVASGVFTVFGVTSPVSGSEPVTRFLIEQSRDLFGNAWAWERDASKIAALMVGHIDERRRALGLRPVDG